MKVFHLRFWQLILFFTLCFHLQSFAQELYPDDHPDNASIESEVDAATAPETQGITPSPQPTEPTTPAPVVSAPPLAEPTPAPEVAPTTLPAESFSEKAPEKIEAPSERIEQVEVQGQPNPIFASPQPAPVTEGNKSGLIEVQYPARTQLAYRDRRGKWSGLFGVSSDSFLPDKYESILSTNTYESLFGRAHIKMMNGHFGAKRNFAIGGVSTELVYGSGSIKDSRVGVERHLSLTKMGIELGLELDTLFSQPYVVPYVKGDFVKFSYAESSADTTLAGKSESTGFSTGLVAGALIQLNVLDPEASITAYNSEGLNNTYLDVFVSQYGSTSSSGKAQLQTSTSFGAGLVLEF